MKVLLYLCSVLTVKYCSCNTLTDLATPDKGLGEFCGYESCPRTEPGVLNVHIVPHTHAEVGHFRTFDQHFTGMDDYYDKTNVNMKRILDSVISSLWEDENRKFTFSDIAYLFKWWNNREATAQRMVHELVRQGRLQLVGGGWTMSDEATTSYHSVIDQFTYSLRKLNHTFRSCGRPLVSWQADSFGHSASFASLMALMGFDAHFINPISYDDELQRMDRKEMEFVWTANTDLGQEADIFTHKLFDGYWSPPGFCFGSQCSDPVVIEEQLTRNVEERLTSFIQSMQFRQAPHFRSSHLLVMMGVRFGYYDAPIWFQNIDKLIRYLRTHTIENNIKFNAFYSSPACYLKEIQKAELHLPVKRDDFFPVAFNKDTQFSGMFTSRPTLKRLAREGHGLLQVVKQIQVLANIYKDIKLLEEYHWIMGIFQDHNVLSGALRPYVKDRYMDKLTVVMKKSVLFVSSALNKMRKNHNSVLYSRCQMNISYCEDIDNDDFYIVVYNPLGWPVAVPVRLPVPGASYIVSLPGNNYTKSVVSPKPDFIDNLQSVPKKAHELVFIASLPPLGFKCYFIHQAIRHRRSIYKNINRGIKLFRHFGNNGSSTDEFNENLELPESYDDYFDDGSLTNFNNTPMYDNLTQSFISNFHNIRDEFGRDMQNATVRIDTYTAVPMFRSDNRVRHPERTTEMIMTAMPKTTGMTTVRVANRIVPTSITPTKTLVPTRSTPKMTTSTETTTYFTTKPIAPPKTKKSFDKAFISTSTEPSLDCFIGNKYINITFDSQTGVQSVELSNGIKVNLNIEVLYYVSDQTVEQDRVLNRKPGAYVFRPIDAVPVPAKKAFKSKVMKSELVEELQVWYGSFVNYVVRVYKDFPYFEIDWLLSAIPIDEKPIPLGKEVFIRYTTDLKSNGVFYTDSNGRQTMRREYGKRETYEPISPNDIAGNYYPVTSKIFIEDKKKNIRFSVFNDRSQGATSKKGLIDILIHRRILTDDANFQAFLHDFEATNDLSVRGKHYIYITKANYNPNLIYEKRLAKEIELQPEIFVSKEKSTEIKWASSVNEYSGLTKKLPIGLHLLTLQEWDHGGILLRLENFLEKRELSKSGVRKIKLENLFKNFSIVKVKEMMLAANMYMKDWTPFNWNYYNRTEMFQGKYSGEIEVDREIELRPQEIRTFIAWTKINSDS